MSTSNGEKPRLILPRWRDFRTTVELGELDPAKSAPMPFNNSVEISQRLREWREAPSLFSGADYVCAAFSAGAVDDDVREAAKAIQGDARSKALATICDAILSQGTAYAERLPIALPVNHATIQAKIIVLKSKVRRHPRNPFYWSDLSHNYAIAGQYAKAEKAMRIALSLAPADRHIVRSAAILLLLVDAGGEALSVLRKSIDVTADPWLIATEISASEHLETTSKFSSLAKRMAESADMSPFHLSEMIGSLATLEIFNGAHKKAKDLFKRSLVQPNENVVAQVIFHNQDVKIDIKKDMLAIPRSFESGARECLRDGKFLEAYDLSLAWLRDQPLSSRAAIFGSYVASIALQDEQKSFDILMLAKNRIADVFMLQNNLAVSLSLLGKPGEAYECLKHVRREDLSARDKCVRLATLGLISFRSGLVEEGRKLYEEALGTIDRTEEAPSYVIGHLYFAREEKNAGNPEWIKVTKKVEKLVKSMNLPELTAFFRSIAGSLPTAHG